jgi:citrate lyase beta subunit
VRKALASEADAVVADLEDAVAQSEKDAARALVRDVFTSTQAATRPLRLVRVNAVGTPFFADDLAMAVVAGADGIVLPKATPEAVDALGVDGPPIVAIVETAQGVRLAYEIASKPRVVALQIGAVDLGAEVGLELRTDGQELVYVRSKVVFDSVATGLRTPFDVVHVDIEDDGGLEAECRLARTLGFRGKACIHPRQVAIVNRAFTPTDTEIEWANRVVQAYETATAGGHGVLAVEGSMVDLPVVERARRVLAEADRR